MQMKGEVRGNAMPGRSSASGDLFRSSRLPFGAQSPARQCRLATTAARNEFGHNGNGDFLRIVGADIQPDRRMNTGEALGLDPFFL
jgi:hypothetical protein